MIYKAKERNMEPITKFIECLLPVTACNLKCSYCYVIQEDRRALKIPKPQFDMDTIQRALRKERWGGTCYFSICGAGETLIPDYIVEMVRRILENGHYVNVTTNGTLTRRFEEIVETFPKDDLQRLHFAFSLHYLELKRLKLLDAFFANVKRVREAGCSFVVQLNMCDEYMPHIEQIKAQCMQELGALPQVAVTRREDGFPVRKVSLMTDGDPERYIEMSRKFNSPLFEYTLKNFNVPRREFCYAGAWTYQLNLQTGLLKRCYNSCVVQNIFKNTEKPIFNLAVGHACNSLYCNNSSHFMSQGVIPELPGPTYAELRNRPEAAWYNPMMAEALNHKLSETNKEYGAGKRLCSACAGFYDKLAYRAYEILLTFRTKKGSGGKSGE